MGCQKFRKLQQVSAGTLWQTVEQFNTKSLLSLCMVSLIDVTLLIYFYVLFTLGQCLEAPARAGPHNAAHTIK